MMKLSVLVCLLGVGSVLGQSCTTSPGKVIGSGDVKVLTTKDVAECCSACFAFG